MAAPKYSTVRLSLTGAAIEFRVTANKIKSSIKGLNIEAGPDGKFSIHDIHRALADSSGLKHRASEARYQRQIDEAKVFADKVAVNRRDLVKMTEVREFTEDIQTTFIQAIRHATMPQTEKDIIIKQLGEKKFE